MKILCLLPFLLLLLLIAAATTSTRPLSRSYSWKISDGVDVFETEDRASAIKMEEGDLSSSGDDQKCEQLYGFLPCSDSVAGHLFLILMYEYLLFHGESYVAGGGERIFKILGPGVFGACAFQIIGSLPESLILLVSGLLNTHEVAQECALTGVGLVAGSSILLLTLVWGTCIVLGTQDYSNFSKSASSPCKDHSNQNPIERLFLSLWPGYGVVTDSWTGYIARIMLLSVIPFSVIQFPRLFGLSSVWERLFVLITLIVSVLFLLSYFFYQLFQPWIQRRQLMYLKHGHLVVDILKHVQNQTMNNLFTDDGAPNLSVITRLFEKTDQDGDNFITASELKEFLQDIKFRRLYSDKNKMTEDMMKDFDINLDNKIAADEFVRGMAKWVEKLKRDSNQGYSLSEVLQPWIEKKREEREIMKDLIPAILQHLQTSMHDSLLTKHGTPDVPAIKRLFEEVDHDKDDLISRAEWQDLAMNIKYGAMPQDTDAAASQMMEELDVNGDQFINEEEFVAGLSKWLRAANQTQILEKRIDTDYEKTWEQTDKLVEHRFVDKSILAWIKAISLVILGIVMLGVLAEPLIQSVQNLSKAASIPSFFIAFVFVPFATNARIAISAITEARRKKLNVTSLTLSELYGTVLMNNLLGFSVLLSLVYFRNLSWDFSIEILTVLIVSAVMGCLASFSSILPVWSALLAYLLYPLSLVMVSVFGDFNWL